MLNKKYLAPEYVGNLCIGGIRYDGVSTDSLNSIGTLLSYFIDTKNNPYKTITNCYETDNLVYLRVLSDIISYKISNATTTAIEAKQYLLNQIDGKFDENSFVKGQRLINYIVKNIDNDNFVNSKIAIEFDKCLKFITLRSSIVKLSELESNFYSDDVESSETGLMKYEGVLSNVFVEYKNSLVSDDFVLGNDTGDVSEALDDVLKEETEILDVDFLSEIKFIARKRVGILVGASGAGKSMMLCHAASHWLQNKKPDNQKHLIFYFTFENAKSETFLRIIANTTGIPIDDIKERIADDPSMKEYYIKKYLDKKDNNSILIISELPANSHSMSSIDAKLKKTLMQYKDAKIYGVILDYVDKMLPVSIYDRKLQTYEKVGKIVDDFKALTKIYDCGGITVSQYNREGTKKSKSDDQLPEGTDIGGGISKYENADIVILMMVQDCMDTLGYNKVVLLVDKHRYAAKGTIIDCIFKPHLASFTKYDPIKDSDTPPKKIKKDNDFNVADIF